MSCANSVTKGPTKIKTCIAALIAGITIATSSASAADWSDTSIGYRYGNKFAEPFNNSDITKNIVNLTHVSGYKYGTNFFNADLLMSDKNDSVSGNNGAQEVYVVYRHTLDLGKISAKEFKFGPVRGFGITAGFDFNSKSGDGYNSKKRMLVAGPTLMMDVPGFLNVSLLELWESNAPNSIARYSYKTHPMLSAAWGIPMGSLPLSFEGFANFVASKGKDEFGGNTAAETLIDAQVMADMGTILGCPKNTFKLGLGYEYWKNKFGNDSSGPAGKGAFAKTPMIRAEYHF